MAKKNNSGTKITIKGDVKAGRDVIMGDQYNVDVANVTTPAEFTAKLAEIQAAIAALKQEPVLTSVQKRNVEAAEQQVAKAAEEARKPDADGEKIKETLTEAKDTFDLLSGGLEAAVKLGKTLATIIGFVKMVFGM